MSPFIVRNTKSISREVTVKVARMAATTVLSITAMFAAVPAYAENGAEYPSVVPTFKKVCLVAGVDPADRIKVLEEVEGWTEDPNVTVDVPGLGISRAISVNYSFRKVKEARQWSGMIDGQKARIVLASFDGKVRYPHLCALVMEGAKNAMPYGGELREAFKNYGIKGKSVDLVHYYEFAGKLKPGEHPVEKKHPVRGEIFTRSQSGNVKETMHIYVAY